MSTSQSVYEQLVHFRALLSPGVTRRGIGRSEGEVDFYLGGGVVGGYGGGEL